MEKKTSIKEEIEKLKNMSFKDKLWYIKEYYLLYIIIIAVFTIFFGYLGSLFFKKDPVFTCVFVNKPISEENQTLLYEDFEKYENLKKPNDIWLLDPSFNIILENGKITNGFEYLAKLNAMVLTNSVDSMITEEFFINHFHKQGLFKDLETILPKELSSKLKDKFLYIEDENNIKKAYAIDISSSPKIKQYLDLKGPIYYGILANANHQEKAISFLNFLYSN